MPSLLAEAQGRERGMRAMRLELLVPLGRRRPRKGFLKEVYEKRVGRRITRRG